MSMEPPPVPLGVSDEQAVGLCRDWMVHLGAADTVQASGEARNACDLYSRRYLVWVSNRRGNLEEDPVVRASRVASSDGRQPLIFVRGGVFPEAQQQANVLGVALFSFKAVDGSLEGANELGRQLRLTGLRS